MKTIHLPECFDLWHISCIDTYTILLDLPFYNHMRKTLTIILSVWTVFTYAQLTEEDCRFLDRPNGDVIISFNDSTTIHLGDIKDSHYPAAKIGLVKTEFFNTEDSTIAPEAILYGPDKKPIGTIKVEVKATEAKPSDVLRWRKYTWVKIEGFVNKRDIYYYSIPEKGIERLVNSKNRSDMYDKMRHYFRTLEFVKEEFDDYTSYAFLDENITLDKEKPYRTIVIMRGGTSLYCVITAEKPFDLLKQKDFKENGAGHYYFVTKPSDKVFDLITDIAYTYIPL